MCVLMYAKINLQKTTFFVHFVALIVVLSNNMKTERRLDFVNEVMGSEPHTLVYNYVAKIQAFGALLNKI